MRIIAALFLLASSSAAAAVAPRQYASLLGGIGLPMHTHIAGEEDAISGLFLGGARVHENAAFELGVGFTYVDLGTAATDASRRLVPITVTAKGILPLWALDLYVLGGVGMYVAWQYEAPKRVPPGPRQTSSDVAAGVHGGGGAALALGDVLALTAEARYHLVRVELFGTRTRIDDLELLGGLTFRF